MSQLATTIATGDGTGGRDITCLPFSLSGPIFPEAIRAYARAFAEPPYRMDFDENVRGMTTRLGTVHAQKPGLIAIAALDGARVCGMVYGYHLERGDWWGDFVRRHLSPESQREWCEDTFVLVELGVEPESQGHGIGSALLEAAIDCRPERTVLLSTRTDAKAHHLYRRRGFEALTEMNFGRGPWHYIMGRRLR